MAGARCGRASARTSAVAPWRRTATPVSRSSTGVMTASGNSGVGRPTLAARSSEWTTISIIRVTRKSCAVSAQPCQGMSTGSSEPTPSSTPGSAASRASTMAASRLRPRLRQRRRCPRGSRRSPRRPARCGPTRPGRSARRAGSEPVGRTGLRAAGRPGRSGDEVVGQAADASSPRTRSRRSSCAATSGRRARSAAIRAAARTPVALAVLHGADASRGHPRDRRSTDSPGRTGCRTDLLCRLAE